MSMGEVLAGDSGGGAEEQSVPEAEDRQDKEQKLANEILEVTNRILNAESSFNSSWALLEAAREELAGIRAKVPGLAEIERSIEENESLRKEALDANKKAVADVEIRLWGEFDSSRDISVLKEQTEAAHESLIGCRETLNDLLRGKLRIRAIDVPEENDFIPSPGEYNRGYPEDVVVTVALDAPQRFSKALLELEDARIAYRARRDALSDLEDHDNRRKAIEGRLGDDPVAGPLLDQRRSIQLHHDEVQEKLGEILRSIESNHPELTEARERVDKLSRECAGARDELESAIEDHDQLYGIHHRYYGNISGSGRPYGDGSLY